MIRLGLRVTVAVAAAGSVIGGGAHAAVESSGVEKLLGVTTAVAAVGNGAMSATIGPGGELTSLRWPTPTSYEVLNYTTSNAANARDLPYAGASPNEGLFGGLLLDGGVTWFRDWQVERPPRYLSPDDNIAQVFLRNDGLGLSLTQTFFVPPARMPEALGVLRFDSPAQIQSTWRSGRDSLVIQYELAADVPPAGVIQPIVFMNFAPATPAVSLGINEWKDAGEQDNASVFLWNWRAMLSVGPSLNVSGLAALIGEPALDVQAGVKEMFGLGNTEPFDVQRAAWGRDVFLAAGFDGVVAEYQVGGDRVDGAMGGPNGPDAYDDAADGSLNMDEVAVGNTTSALVTNVEFTQDNTTTWTFRVSAGATAIAALDELQGSRSADTEVSVTRQYWQDFLAQGNLPDTDDPRAVEFAKRALISIATGFDISSGAIVASVTTNPPYNFDWPRDGAYLNYALDVAGYTGLVTLHNLFYTRVVRKEDGDQMSLLFCGDASNPANFMAILGTCAPAGSFSMNYYGDGRPGGPIGFEIDESGLALWSLVEHARFLDTESEPLSQAKYLVEIYPAVRLIADMMARCEDPATGLQCFAFEDDSPEVSQGEQGALAVRAALRNAIDAATAMADRADAARWQMRLDRLDAAILEHYLVPQSGAVAAHIGRNATWAGEAIWPSRFVEDNGMPVTAQAEYIWSETDQPGKLLRYKDPGSTYSGSSYDAKSALRLAMVWPEGASSADRGSALMNILVNDVAMADTLHIGEVYQYGDNDGDGDREFVQTTAQPHIWEQTLSYLTLMAFYNRSGFEPPNNIARVSLNMDSMGAGGGCSCALAPGVRGRFDAWPLYLIIVLAGRRFVRRRKR